MDALERLVVEMVSACGWGNWADCVQDGVQDQIKRQLAPRSAARDAAPDTFASAVGYKQPLVLYIVSCMRSSGSSARCLWNRNSSPALSALGDASAFLVRAPQIWSDDESGRSAGLPLLQENNQPRFGDESHGADRAVSPTAPDPWLTCPSSVYCGAVVDWRRQ